MLEPTLPEFFVGIGVFFLLVLLLSEILNGKDVFSLESCGYSPVFSFGYESDNGPHMWKLSYPECSGCNQSPVNIVTRLAVVLESSEPLKWKGYRLQPKSMTLANDGNSVIVSGVWSDGFTPILKGGPLCGSYNFHSMVFHWGPSNDDGSEHTFDFVKQTMELQMIHVKKGYKSPYDQSLLTMKDGLAIISILFEVTKVDNPYLDPVITNLWKILQPESKVSIPPFPLEWIYPPFEKCYYSYNGSLTRPPCNEIVTWIIQPEPIAVSPYQVAQFRKIRSANGPILLNTRPVQKLNDRQIFFHD